MKKNIEVDSIKIEQTIDKLEKRIFERFPNSNLLIICKSLKSLLEETNCKIAINNKPNYGVRAILILIILISVVLIFSIVSITRFNLVSFDLTFVTSLSDSLFNIIFLFSAGVIYLFSIENKIKRTKIIKTINKLRSFLHVVDMHQLTKDPMLNDNEYVRTLSSPKRILKNYELKRYLDYSSEMISLVSKISTLFAQKIQDDIIISKVNEIESLSSSLTQKIWLKINNIPSNKD